MKDISSKGNTDYRYLPRWTVRNRVSCHFPENICEAQTKDISGAGACLETPHNILSPDQRFDLTLYLNEKTCVRVHGRVVWVKHLENNDQAGIHFYNLSQEAQEILVQHAFKLSGSGSQNFFSGWK